MDYSVLKKIAFDCFRVDHKLDTQTPVLTIATDDSRSFLHNGKYYSPLIDTLEDDLADVGISCISVARILSNFKGSLSYGKVYAPDGGFARALVQKRLIGLVRRRGYPYSPWEEKVWGNILDSTGARNVVGIQPSRELCVACHRRGVWVADMQHGVIADLHPWYGQDFRQQDPIEYLPSAFLCWDEGSADVIRKWAQPKGVATLAIGNRWLARFATKSRQDRLIRELAQAYEANGIRLDQRKTILLSLSWGQVDIPNGFIVEGLEAAIRNSSHEYRWLIRLHQNQVAGFAKDEKIRFTEYFNRRLRGHAEWEAVTKAPLPFILEMTDLHISWASSVCIEAAQMGIRSALLNPSLRSDKAAKYFEPQQRSGMVDLLEGTEPRISAWIRANIGSKRTREAFNAFDATYRDLIARLSR
jgi:hypothetical protein